MDQNPSTNRTEIPELLTARELETLLKIDIKTIYSYVQRGLIPYVRIQSNVRFVRTQIFDWIADHNYRTHAAHARRFRAERHRSVV
jgi:predicted site-specific integrase-resolvase